MQAEWSLLAAPMAAGAIVLLSHVWLGRQVLQRGIVFMDLAVAQMAALGVLIAQTLELDPSWASVASIVGALAGAQLVSWLVRRHPTSREALVGLVYVGAATVATMWVSADPHGGQKLTAMLSGDILWVTWPSMVGLAAGTVAFVGWRLAAPGAFARADLFPALFAVFVSQSVQLLGLYLVFTTLIVPALVTTPDRRGLVTGVALGLAGYAIGLAASLVLDLPSGACVVLALMVTGGAHALIPGHRRHAQARVDDSRTRGVPARAPRV